MRKAHRALAAIKTACLALAAFVHLASAAQTADAPIKVLCANGIRPVLTQLHSRLERTLGQRVTLDFSEAGNLRHRLQSGESADIVVLPKTVLEHVLADGGVVPGTVVDLAQSSIGIGIRADAAKPNIGSAALGAQAKQADHSRQLLGLLSGPDAAPVIEAIGMTPVAKR